MYADAFNVLLALEAGTANELSRLMLLNNLKYSKEFKYQITVKNNKYQAWYYNQLSKEEIMAFQIKKIKAGSK
jgi:hypothetical protein